MRPAAPNVEELIMPMLGLMLLSVLAGQSDERAIVLEGVRPASEGFVGAKAMRYLSFDVPPNVTKLTIQKELDHGPDASAGRIVDHGLFDPNGLGAEGFRGWMGGNPSDIVITGDPTTTSSWFLAGPIPPGKWNLAQYYLQSTPAGLNYKYTIRFSFDGPKPPVRALLVPVTKPATIRREAGWYVGNLHTHTVHSDGGGTLLELAAKNRAAGFDFIVSTEHNTNRSHWEIASVAGQVPDLLLIPGVEFTSPFGHANIIGCRPGAWFDFRFDAGEGKLRGMIREAQNQGAIVMANHPKALCTTCPWRYPEEEWKEIDGIEVWNGKWDLTDEQAVTLWDEMLRKRRKLNAYGGSDYHRGNDPLQPATLVYATRLELRAVMEGLWRGRTVLVADPKGPQLRLTCGTAMPGDTVETKAGVPIDVNVSGGEGLRLLIYGRKGLVREVDALATKQEKVSLAVRELGSGFVRAELRRGGSKGEMVAMTNALFLR